MAYVYRYRDKSDGIIKYIGIVYGKNRTLQQRVIEHLKNDYWCNDNFDIEYITENISNRTDAEYFESHYISLYGTDKYYNKRKSNWGVSNYLPNRENDWKLLDLDTLETHDKSKLLYNIRLRGSDICVYLKTVIQTDEDTFEFTDGRNKRVLKISEIDNIKDIINDKYKYASVYTFNKANVNRYIKEIKDKILIEYQEEIDKITKLMQQWCDVNTIDDVSVY